MDAFASMGFGLCSEAVHACLQASEYTRQSSMESITIPVGPRLGDIVVEAKGVTKAYRDRTLMENLSFSIPPGSIVGAAYIFRN